MSELVLEASDDHVARLAHEGDPIRAIVELVWNSIDADASSVAVALDRDELDGISAVRIADDGHGISSDEVAATFGKIGNSWKKVADRSRQGKRRLHGKFGEGRLRAFALGTRVVWESRCANTAGVMQEVTITGSRSNRHRFLWDAEPIGGTATGTTVTAHNDKQRGLSALDADSAVVTLRSQFAPALLNERSLTITYRGATLDPTPEILRDTSIPVAFDSDGSTGTCEVRVIEWRSGKHRMIYFGRDQSHFVHEERGSDVEASYPFSAYVSWDGLTPDAAEVLSLGDLAQPPVSDMWRAAREAIKEHFATRRRERRREQVEAWVSTGVYPYQGKPTTKSEHVERALFDVISGTLVPHISKRREDARLTLALLRDALRHDPNKLTTILHELVALKDEDRDTLVRLLRETSLSAIVRSADLVASRKKFLAGLEHLLFDPNDSPDVGERDHLHKILERELWIFGESYHLMSSERGLTELLRTHLRLDGLPFKGIEPVKRWDGKSGRTDLHLAAKYKEHDRIRHLVVELKAPDITATRVELDQVEDYANAVIGNPAFATDRAEWDFVLVCTDYDEVVENRIGSGSGLGGFLAPQQKPGRPLVRAFVRRWRDVLDENARRLDFVSTALEHDPSIAEGLNHVREQYADLLPDSLIELGS